MNTGVADASAVYVQRYAKCTRETNEKALEGVYTYYAARAAAPMETIKLHDPFLHLAE